MCCKHKVRSCQRQHMHSVPDKRTWRELRMAKMYWKTKDDSLRVRMPNSQPTPMRDRNEKLACTDAQGK